MIWFVLWLACGGGNDSADGCDFNGDIDGLGTDTGNIPQLFASWTTTFGSRSFYDECEIEGLGRNDFTWLNGGAMQIGGRLDNVEVSLASAPDATLFATMSSQGAVTISGLHTYRGHVLHIALGGLLFDNLQLNLIELEGHGYIGIDVNDDGYIDCGIMGDFNAKASG